MSLLGSNCRRMATASTAASIVMLGTVMALWPHTSAAMPSAASPAVSPAAPPAVVPAAPIGHAGRWITDASGRVLLVSGVNMVSKVPPYTPAADGFNDADGAFLAANGLNAVRVGVLWEALEPQPGVFNDSYLASINSTVQMLRSHGVLALLDFHQDMYNEQFQGEGEPAWAIDDNGLPASPQAGFPANYFFQPALQAAYDNFWGNATVDGQGLQDWYAAAVKHVAGYFNGNPDVLGYDLYNEPFPGTGIWTCLTPGVGCPAQDAKLTAFYTKVTSAVRTANPAAMLFDEPWVTFDFGYPSALGSAGDRETGLSFHDYCPFNSISTTLNIACPPFNDTTFGNAGAVSSRTGDALLLTEFGATNDPSVLSSVVAGAAQARVGWLMWAFCGCGDPTGSPATEGLVNNAHAAPTGSNVNSPMLDALAVPHPELVAGTPGSYGYDTSTAVFTLAYSTQRADRTGRFPAGSQTSITVPAVQYPDGYKVVVSGGRVVSAGSVLDVASCPGAASVNVTVEAGSGSSGGC